ncbi:hypothetical protein GCK32_012327 [Trichostrongylus colubriformis]|uniref:Uncharacterized protein n=1 Tax=Trichostrongylus colubriformis TaxID=6319 RepID=A0AAN8FWW0_TRICO
MMLVVVLCLIVRAHSFSRNQSPTAPAIVTTEKALTFPPGPVEKSPNPKIESSVSHDELDEISRLVLGYTIDRLQSMTTSERDRMLTGYNIVRQQYMRTSEWTLDRIEKHDSQERLKQYYKMVLQWLEALVRREKSREIVKEEMIREWNKLEQFVKTHMIMRFAAFEIINDMARAK